MRKTWVWITAVVAGIVLWLRGPLWPIPGRFANPIAAAVAKAFSIAARLILLGFLGYAFTTSTVKEKDKPTEISQSPVSKSASGSKNPAKPQIRVYVEPPKTIWVPYPGSRQDVGWYRWAAHSPETREACRDSDSCQKAMWRLRQYECLAPDYRLLERCGG